MPRPGSGSIGHSKHRKAFGSKRHKSSLNHILLMKDKNKEVDEEMRIRNNKKDRMFDSIKDLMENS